MRTIGLIGGMSWESSAEYYRLINQGVRDRLGPLRSARLLMHSVDFGPVERAQHEGRWDDAAAILVAAARSLLAGGADCIVLCTNTMHKLADTITRAVSLPLLHIADATGHAASERGWRRVGLLGTAFTMEQPFLVERLATHHGLEVLVPDAEQRPAVHRIIYDELCVGVIREDSRQQYLEVIADLAARGAQAVVLGCTEIGLLIQPQHTAVPLLDSTVLHAQAAVDFALAPEPERSGYWISSEPRHLDFAAMHAYLSRSYWSEGIPRELVERAAAHSIVFGLFHDHAHGHEQVGFARVVTDRTTFAYLADVYVLEVHRGRGLGKRLVEAVKAHPDLQGLRRFALNTRDAHALYAQYGFTPLAMPDRAMEIIVPNLYARC